MENSIVSTYPYLKGALSPSRVELMRLFRDQYGFRVSRCKKIVEALYPVLSQEWDEQMKDEGRENEMNTLRELLHVAIKNSMYREAEELLVKMRNLEAGIR